MDNIRTMQGDLLKASQSPKTVAAVFGSNLKSNPPGKIGVVTSTSPSPLSSVQPSPKQVNANQPAPIVEPRSNIISEPKNIPANLPFTDLSKEKFDSPAKKEVFSSISQPISPATLPSDDVFKSVEKEPAVFKKPLPQTSPAPALVTSSVDIETSSANFLSGRNLKLVFVVLLVLIAGGGTFVYFNYFKSNLPVDSSIIGNNDIIPIVTPESLFPVDGTIKVVADSGVSPIDSVKTAVSSSILEKGSFNRILINKQETPLSLDGFLNDLNINISDEVKNGLTNDYTFFVYGQAQGLRYGLVIKTNNDISSQLVNWESEMFKDLNSLYFDGNPQTVSAEFRDNGDYPVSIRYINLPDPSVSLDYALANNLLIITTSKDSMIDLIGKL